MIVQHRNHDLKYKRAIKADKLSIVLDWLLEFKFSSFDILAERLELKVTSCLRFFTDLVADGVLNEFKNIHTRGIRYLMLTPTSVSYLQADRRDISNAIVRADRLGKHASVMHDLAVQKAAIELIKKYDCDEIIWDRNISNDRARPDLLFHSPKGFWGALEYERWKKKEAKIYQKYQYHVKAISENRYSAIFYYFDQAADMKAYEKLFNKSEWPTFTKDKNHRWKLKKDIFKPSSLPGLEDRFKFVHYPPERWLN